MHIHPTHIQILTHRATKHGATAYFFHEVAGAFGVDKRVKHSPVIVRDLELVCLDALVQCLAVGQDRNGRTHVSGQRDSTSGNCKAKWRASAAILHPRSNQKHNKASEAAAATAIGDSSKLESASHAITTQVTNNEENLLFNRVLHA